MSFCMPTRIKSSLLERKKSVLGPEGAKLESVSALGSTARGETHPKKRRKEEGG